MITDTYQVDSRDSAMNAINQMTRTVCFCGLEPEMKQRITQLANAMIEVGDGLDEVAGMEIWLETKDNDDVVLHLKATGVVDLSEKDRLLELSSDGKNLDRKTVGGKIAGFFQDIFMGNNEEYHTYGYTPAIDPIGEFDYPVLWGYSAYDADLTDRAGRSWNQEAASEVERLADEVKMGISSSEVEILATLHPQGQMPHITH